MSEFASVALEAAMHGPGVSFRMVCPICGGGSSEELSLSVTTQDDGAVLYKCHRASCDAHGVVQGSGNFVRTKPPTSVKVPERFMDLVPLNETLYDWIYANWLITASDATDIGKFKFDTESGRIAMPMFAHDHKLNGWVLRATDRKVSPKTLNVVTEGALPHSYYGDRNDLSTLYIVEDIPSAVRLARYGQTLALCGTHLGIGALVDLVGTRYDHVWIALDADATQKAIAMRGGLAPFLNDVWVQVLNRDVKDMTEQEVKELDMVRKKYGST